MPLPAAKKVVVLQSNYLPWKGYFDLIRRADLFIFYDDTQFTKNDWRNRNKIKTPRGPEWISIPCGQDIRRLINEVKLNDNSWQKDHWNRILINYQATEFFGEYREFFEDFYLKRKWTSLSELNQYLITTIATIFLGCKTQFQNSTEYDARGLKEARLLDLLKKAGATEYISGPTAKSYLPEADFVAENIKVTWMDYSHYREYNQPYPPFVHEVSVIDLLFCTGPQAMGFIQ